VSHGADLAVLETARLILREFHADDAVLLYRHELDPDVMRFVDTGRRPTLDDLRDEVFPRLRAIGHEHPGLGFFPAFERATGRYIGWFHYRPHDGNPTVADLGYQLLRAFWGRGYATEGSAGLVRRGFADLGVTRVVGHALRANVASLRVMEKVGLRPVGEFIEPRAIYPDPLAVSLALDRPDRSGCSDLIRDQYTGPISRPGR
jgi:RimJ/RimL family protein N-acetyltransferase